METDNFAESAEMQEVADPAEDVSAEMQEAADPAENGGEPEQAQPVEPSPEEQKRSEQDAAFAEMRRQNQELQRLLAERDRASKQMQDALGLFFEGKSPEELAIAAKAYAQERSVEDVKADYEREQTVARLMEENQNLNKQITDIQVDRLMADALREIQTIDPEVKSLESLGKNFADYIAAGLSNKQAYYAAKSLDAGEKVYAPAAIGKANSSPVERDYYTSEELDNLTDAEINANREKVWRSMNRL